MIYQSPLTPTKSLSDDFDGNSTVFSSFRNDGGIISQVDNRFIMFNSHGQPNDVIEFDGYSNKYKGEKKIKGRDHSYFLVYWHDYLCSNDDGINR